MDEPIALGPGEGTPVKADRPELSLLEVTFDPGRGVDPHFHKGHSDSFYVCLLYTSPSPRDRS